jgi:hypothetical protein
MQTLYCKSEDSFVNLLAPIEQELDSMYWIVACQTSPVSWNWINESAKNERLLNDLQLSVAAFERHGFQLWKLGALSRLRKVLTFDEWSYFLGFRATESEAVARASRLGSLKFFSPEFYKSLAEEGQIFVVFVDGWWEFSTASGTLFKSIRDNAPCREIELRNPGEIDWTPRFCWIDY